MSEMAETELAHVAALIGEPARARMLAALMSGTALTATELALEAGVSSSTASAHLARLAKARILVAEPRGRHRYYRLSDAEIAQALESLMIASAGRRTGRRPGPADPQLREARVCYDHLAGARGVWLLDQLRTRQLVPGGDGDGLSSDGRTFFAGLGIDLPALEGSRRPLCRMCLDWSERRHHLGGSLGAALLGHILGQRWARRQPGSRAVLFTTAGERSMQQVFGTGG